MKHSAGDDRLAEQRPADRRVDVFDESRVRERLFAAETERLRREAPAPRSRNGRGRVGRRDRAGATPGVATSLAEACGMPRPSDEVAERRMRSFAKGSTGLKPRRRFESSLSPDELFPNVSMFPELDRAPTSANRTLGRGVRSEGQR